MTRASVTLAGLMIALPIMLSTTVSALVVLRMSVWPALAGAGIAAAVMLGLAAWYRHVDGSFEQQYPTRHH